MPGPGYNAGQQSIGALIDQINGASGLRSSRHQIFVEAADEQRIIANINGSTLPAAGANFTLVTNRDLIYPRNLNFNVTTGVGGNPRTAEIDVFGVDHLGGSRKARISISQAASVADGEFYCVPDIAWAKIDQVTLVSKNAEWLVGDTPINMGFDIDATLSAFGVPLELDDINDFFSVARETAFGALTRLTAAQVAAIIYNSSEHTIRTINTLTGGQFLHIFSRSSRGLG